MTPLRQRFIEDLQPRNRSPKTIEAYVYHVRELACYFNQSPEQLGDDQIHRYLLHLLHHKQVSWSSYNQAVAALRFFYSGNLSQCESGKRDRSDIAKLGDSPACPYCQ